MGTSPLQIDAALLAQAEAAGVKAEEVAEAAIRAALRQLDTSAEDARAAGLELAAT